MAIGTAFVLLALSVRGGDQGAETILLISKLGAPRYAEREAASAALLARGREVLEALQDASHSEDPEVRTRAEALIDRIERDQLTQPMLVTLEPGTRPRGRVVSELARQTGFSITLDPGDRPGWADEPFEVPREGRSLWEWVETLGLDAAWSFEREATPFIRPADPVLRVEAPKRSAPASAHGPFRFVLRDVVASELPFPARGRLTRIGAAPDAGRVTPIELRMELLAEPRLRLRAIGTPSLLEATDDRGRNLARPDFDDPGLFDFDQATVGFNPLVPFAVPLRAEGPAPAKLRRVRGRLPVEVEARRFEPTEIDLDLRRDGRLPSPVALGDATLVGYALSGTGNGQTFALELTIQPSGWSDMVMIRRGPWRRRAEIWNVELDHVLAHIEVVDANDRPLRFGAGRSIRFSPEGIRVACTVQRAPGVGPPRRLRHYGTIREVLVLNFELNDIDVAGTR
jgi:hypothetical protein